MMRVTKATNDHALSFFFYKEFMTRNAVKDYRWENLWRSTMSVGGPFLCNNNNNRECLQFIVIRLSFFFGKGVKFKPLPITYRLHFNSLQEKKSIATKV